MTIPATLVQQNVLTTQFACDLGACKGACCTLPGGRGAPLLDEEVEIVRKAAELLAPELSERHQQTLRIDGPVEGSPGQWHTVCVDHASCVFVVMDDGVARCAIERAHAEGRFAWRKPVSCHLFPIRIDRGDPRVVRYERFDVCEPGRVRGRREATPLVDFVGPALERALGPSWRSILRDGDDRS